MNADDLRLAKIRAEGARFDEPAKSAFIALREFQSGLPVDQTCPFCRTAIRVGYCDPRNNTCWETKCDCGKCDSTFRGI